MRKPTHNQAVTPLWLRPTVGRARKAHAYWATSTGYVQGRQAICGTTPDARGFDLADSDQVRHGCQACHDAIRQGAR